MMIPYFGNVSGIGALYLEKTFLKFQEENSDYLYKKTGEMSEWKRLSEIDADVLPDADFKLNSYSKKGQFS